MNEFLDFINENRWINIAFLVLAFLGILTTIITYYWSRRKKKIVYSTKSFNLINDKVSSIDKLKIDFSGRKIFNFTSSKIRIWNSGSAAIYRSEIAPKDKLRVAFQDKSEILDVKIIMIENEINNIKIKNDSNSVDIDFDYLGAKEGFTIQLYHTGKNDTKIAVRGTIIDGDKIEKWELDNSTAPKLLSPIIRTLGDNYNKSSWFFKCLKLPFFVLVISGIAMISFPVYLIELLTIYNPRNEFFEKFKI